MTWLDAITPRHILDLVPYSSARREASEGEIWLNANENPFAGSDADETSNYNRYPDAQPGELIEAYSKYAGVDQNQILVTRGIDEGIDLLTRTFCVQGKDRIIFTPPTYGMYKISAETHGVEAFAVPLIAQQNLDCPMLEHEAPQSKLTYICSPNNPTGNIYDSKDIEFALKATVGKSLVVVDEAYIEFDQKENSLALLEKYENLIILRTLSKAFGKAGLRCGFVIAAPEIIQLLQKVIAPYPIPVPVVDVAARALFRDGISQMSNDVESILTERERLNTILSELMFVKEIYPSSTNFILFKVNDAQGLMTFLLKAGIVIRDRSTQLGLENTVRVTIGTPNEMSTLVNQLKEYEAQL